MQFVREVMRLNAHGLNVAAHAAKFFSKARHLALIPKCGHRTNDFTLYDHGYAVGNYACPANKLLLVIFRETGMQNLG
ncbi:MAG: hypothetical protein DDT39_00289 [Firmicutes bacterium]|nr:hypothetical protein [candidate division NPL-UPA2 bacterium]MBT9153632.1 hypothetical protein [candidate division NPL-UPA2 bacterium]